MKFRPVFLFMILGMLWLAGCSKSEPAATATASAVDDPVPPATTPMEKAAGQMLNAFQVPNLMEVSPDKLAAVSSDALSQLGQMAASSNVDMSGQLDALKAALTKENAMAALDQLPAIISAAQQIPGADAAIASTQQMITGWALKQGFDPATINPMLASLQAADFGRLAAQASTLMGTGDLTDQQINLINGVLANYGVDAQATEVINSVKGLFER
jgi:hypothetical protein